MNSWIFYLTDSLNTMTAVAGEGELIADAEVDALAKWDTAISGREDYAERAHIVGVIYSAIATEPSGDDMPGLIL